MKNSKGFNLLTVIIIICVVSVVSGITTGIIVMNTYHGVDYSDSALSEFLSVYSEIVNGYYEDINKEEMLVKAKDAMFEYLGDPYTTYLNSEEREALEEKLNGTYKGIGLSFANRVVLEVMKDTPAEAAGIQPGDIFYKVDGQLVDELSDNEISALIKNSDKTKVKLVVLRNEEEMEFTMEIKTVIDQVVSSTMIRDTKIGYISIPVFSKTIAQQVEAALKELEKQDMKSLVIDLRGDSGGYLEQAQVLASLFLEKGKLIYSLENKNGKDDYYDETDTKRTYKIAILIDGGSASASEILAAALKDSYGAVLVGSTSYGKGKVQQTYKLSDGTMAKYTSAKWFRPDGTCIDGEGLKPDYAISISEEVYDEDGKRLDSQLEKAIEVLGTD